MCVRLFVTLVFITTIVANDSPTSQYESISKYNNYNQAIIRKLVTETLNDPPNASQTVKITDNKTNATGIGITNAPIEAQDKNGTTIKNPVTEKEGMSAESFQTVISYPPYATYEVTENVIDIPDDRPPVGPIVPNYNVRPPILNLAKPNNKTNKDKVAEANKTKKNRLSILHINAEFEDKVPEINENKVFGIFKGIKEYIHGFQKGIVKGFHNFFHKHQDHGERYVRAVDKKESSERNGDQNVDKSERFVHHRHIRMT